MLLTWVRIYGHYSGPITATRVGVGIKKDVDLYNVAHCMLLTCVRIHGHYSGPITATRVGVGIKKTIEIVSKIF